LPLVLEETIAGSFTDGDNPLDEDDMDLLGFGRQVDIGVKRSIIALSIPQTRGITRTDLHYLCLLFLKKEWLWIIYGGW
jgi:hypothetical protein